MRTLLSLKNISSSLISQVLLIILGFLSRKIFIDNLGVDYLGVNGLLTNVLSMMVLIEGGIAISIVYNLYKPLAENDKNKIIALVQLYQKAYSILSIVILLMSIALYPILEHLIKGGGNIRNLTIVYVIFVLKSMLSYLNAHKWSLINADQRGYLLTKINLIYQLLSMISKIIILMLSHNYVLYLLVELILYGIQMFLNGKTVNKHYSYIKTKKKYKIDEETKINIMKNVKAMFLQNIGGYLVFGTDNILISSFISVAAVGLYSNYSMITQQLSALVSPVLGGIGASVGNLIATENIDKNYTIFKVSFLLNFWIYSLCIISLYNCLELFISLWLGKQYLLPQLTFIFILINFYLDGMRATIATFKNKAGLFTQDKYAPLIEGGVNILSSLLLIKYFGLAGIFMGTTISTIITVLWTQPYIVYKHLFKKPVWTYFFIYSSFTLITFFTCIVMMVICNKYFEYVSFFSLVMRGILCLVIPSLLYGGIFYKTKEFQYLLSIPKNIALRSGKINQKITSSQ